MSLNKKMLKFLHSLRLRDQSRIQLSCDNAIFRPRSLFSIDRKNHPNLLCQKNLQDDAMQTSQRNAAKFFFPYEFHIDDSNFKVENCSQNSLFNILLDHSV